MLKIFKTYGNMLMWWFIFSAVNYKWPANDVYASWNVFTIDSQHFWKIFGLFSCFFIASCYGYLQKTRDEDIKTLEECKTRADVLQEMLKKKER